MGSYAARSRHKRVGMKHWIGADCGPRSAPTWRSCLTTQLEQELRRKSASEQGCGNGLRARKGWTLQAGAYVAALK